MRKTYLERWFDLSFAGVMITCFFLAIIGVGLLLDDWIKEFDTQIDNKSYPVILDVNDFPNHYRSQLALSIHTPKRLDYIHWMVVWYTNPFSFDEYEFTKDQLRQKSAQLLPWIQTPHPIWTVDGVSPKQLNRLPKVHNYATFSDFNDVVDKITNRETSLGQNPEWQQKVSSWNLVQTQSRVMFIYLVYLDQQDDLSLEVVKELDGLVTQIGRVNWYKSVQDHLNMYWL